MLARGLGKFLAVVFLLSLTVVLAAGVAWAKKPSHMDRAVNVMGCAGCHAGRGVPGSALLKADKERICFECHGTFSRGRSSKHDVESVFSKTSVHPVLETTMYHVPGEELPEKTESQLRHVSCFDCHMAHLSTASSPMRGSKGYIPGPGRRGRGFPPAGMKLRRATEAYEVCYLCHSESANLPLESTNIAELLDPGNASYHPVEAPGKNSNVPSLMRNLSVSSTVECSDCHGNNDVMGPKGPHGSDYPPILKAEFNQLDGPEDPKRYELCYMCHDRRSVLGDESFKYHNRHVVLQSTSCYTCHNSHGSSLSGDLIDFKTDVVLESNVDGGPEYLPASGGRPRCYLNCHGIEHNSAGVAGNPWP